MTFSLRIVVVFFLCLGSTGFAQNNLLKTIDSINTVKGAENRAQLFEKCIAATDTTKNTKIIGMLFHEAGLNYYKIENYEKALLYLTKAIAVKIQYSDKVSLNKSLFLAAYIYQIQEKTQKTYQLCEQIIKAQGSDKYTCYAYRTLAEIELDKGDFHKALAYLNEAFSNKKITSNRELLSLLSETMIYAYACIYESRIGTEDKKNDFQTVLLHEKIIEDNLALINEYNLPDIYNNLAIVYDAFGALEKALIFYKKAQEIYRESGDIYNELDVTINIGILYSKQKKHVLAAQQFQRAIDEADDVDQIANAYNSKGYYLNAKSSTEKLPYLEKAVITILELDKQLGNNFRLPTIAEINESDYEQDVLIYLIDLADHYVQVFHEKKEKKYLLKAKETVILIDQLVSLIRYDVDSEASKLFWIEKGVNTYMLAVEICYLLNDAEKVFYFMEKNKALLLQEKIKTLQTKLASDVPRELREQEYQLYYEGISLQEQFQQQIDNDSIQQVFADKKKEYQIFMDSLQRMYPKYTKTKEKVEIVSLKDIVEIHKQNKTAFVEYILHENDGYGIFYDGKNPVVFKINAAEAFQKQLSFLRTFMVKRDLDTKEQKEFHTIGYKVFQQLFPFNNASQRLQNKKITIIPDHTLQYIPFEVLPMQATGKLSESYLVNTTEISYLQSFSLFEQIQQKQNAPTKTLLAITPIEFANKELPTLSEATEVFVSFEKETASVFLQRAEATKENFLKHRNNFNIIHLNTHAGLDSITQTPWIAFQDSNMTLNELFGLENQAELVVLDACKTNDGVNLSGEGIINLSRGFFYNGTQSVLASQWNVNEKTGNEILQTFYSELKNGHSKSKALQLAKKKYLQTHAYDIKQVTPYYWAAFTLTGSTKAVAETSWFNVVTITIGTMLLILLLVFYNRKKIFK
ncbi:CHAT domain-containing protein [uncultured Kordia sp.]|uniref:CHAT domain-containing protein n=1 Tax=uncultured Kordia sp. TaxID=507699 RepID=UPI002601947E|nr:CHAT domain-containing protein [uncultured Kordia sp.]